MDDFAAWLRLTFERGPHHLLDEGHRVTINERTMACRLSLTAAQARLLAAHLTRLASLWRT